MAIEWIATSEEMPQRGVTVLVYMGGYIDTHVVWNRWGVSVWDGAMWAAPHVTHWAHLDHPAGHPRQRELSERRTGEP